MADLLFGVQIIGATLFCGAYIHRATYDVTGTSIVQFGTVIAFLSFNLMLGIGAHREGPSRNTRQSIAIYVTWLTLMTTLFVTAASNSAYQWNRVDTVTLQTAIGLTALVLVGSRVAKVPLNDPSVKGSLAIAYKSVPQVLLAWKFILEGATGTPALSILVGHFTILLRIGHILLTAREGGWNRSLRWLAISETLNELSWLIATAAWLVA